MPQDNIYKAFGSASVTTAIQPVWTPAAGKIVEVGGAIVAQLSAAAAQYDLTDGTVAAAATIATFGFGAAGGPVDLPIRKLLTGTVPLGIKARATAGSVVATFYGRER
jgi:hypothetical protein